MTTTTDPGIIGVCKKAMLSFLKNLFSRPDRAEQELELEVQYFKEQFPELTEEEIRETIHVIEAIYGDDDTFV